MIPVQSEESRRGTGRDADRVEMLVKAGPTDNGEHDGVRGRSDACDIFDSDGLRSDVAVRIERA